MISRNTVLVLGAGASQPFGLPLGYQLVRSICEDKAVGPGPSAGETLLNYGFVEPQIKAFRDQLEASARPSVDAFLEHRPELMKIGKAAMAASLLPLEAANPRRFYRATSWYGYLFNGMTVSFDDFAKNKLAVVTFNYDRSFEYFMLSALHAAFGRNEAQCRETLSHIPVIHLYGQLGSLDPADADFVGFGASPTPEAVNRCIDGIRIIREERSDGAGGFGIAQEVLKQAERIAFLGFGYDEINLNRLLGDLSWSGDGRPSVYGTAVGITDFELVRPRDMFNEHGLFLDVEPGWSDSVELLRNRPVLA